MACKPGFFGASCDSPCPLGFYGKYCAGVCFPICSEEECDPIKGCEFAKEINIQTTNSGVVQTSRRGIQEAKNASAIYSTTSIKNVLIVTEDTLGVFNSTYVLHGLGVAISLFLLVIVIQLCKKSKSTKRKRVTREAREENDSHNESQFQQQEENRSSYISIPESVKTIQVYRSLEAEYDEINEQIPIQYPSSSNSSFNNENTNISLKQMPLTLHDSLKDDMMLEHKSYPVIVCEDNSDSIASEGNASRNIAEVDAYIDPF